MTSPGESSPAPRPRAIVFGDRDAAWRTKLPGISGPPGFGGLVASTLALGTATSFVVPYLSIWATQKIGLSAWQFGMFMTTAALCSILVSTTLARWSDSRLSRRSVLTLGALGGMSGYAGYAWCSQPLMLVAIAGTFIALSSACFPQLFAHVRETYDEAGEGPSRGGIRISLIRMCFSLAWTAGPAGAALVMQHLGFRGLFMAAAVLYALFLAGVRRWVPHRVPTPHPHTRLPVWRVLAKGEILAVFLAFVAVFAAYALNMMNLPLLITKVLGGTTRDVGIAFGLGPLVEIPLMVWFGHLAGRGYQRRLIIWGAGVTVLYFVALGLATKPWHVFPIQILSGISFAILTNVAIMYFQDLLPGQAGLGTAIFSNAGNVGNLTGFFTFGVLIAPLGHRAVYAICALLVTVTLVIVTTIRPKPTFDPPS